MKMSDSGRLISHVFLRKLLSMNTVMRVPPGAAAVAMAIWQIIKQPVQADYSGMKV
jgi:hypothetical protein